MTGIDLVHSLTTERAVFVDRLRLESRCLRRLLLIPAALSDVKSPTGCIGGSPNRITPSLIAILAGMGIPFLCSETAKGFLENHELLPRGR